jgi:hypothetical protein
VVSLLLLAASLFLWMWLDRRFALRQKEGEVEGLGEQLLAVQSNCSAFLNLTDDAATLLANKRAAAEEALLRPPASTAMPSPTHFNNHSPNTAQGPLPWAHSAGGSAKAAHSYFGEPPAPPPPTHVRKKI